MAVRATKTQEGISIPPIDIMRTELRIVGDSPLLVHAWDEKVKKDMLDKMIGKAKVKARDMKDPVREFINSLYWLEGKPEGFTEQDFEEALESGKAIWGFKSVAFKSAAVSGAYRAKVTKDKVSMYGAFHIDGEYVEIKGVPEMREDMVKVANGAPDMRYRGVFNSWETILPISYNAGVLTLEQVANLFNLGGFSCGVGEWRVEKGGSFGMFHVA